MFRGLKSDSVEFYVLCFLSSLSYLLFMGIFFGSVAGEIDSED